MSTPTDAQLREAWDSCRQRDGWPQDYETAMHNPLYGALVRLHANRLAALRARRQAAAAHALTAQAPRLPRLQFDPKRLAAGDDTDDDAA